MTTWFESTNSAFIAPRPALCGHEHTLHMCSPVVVDAASNPNDIWMSPCPALPHPCQPCCQHLRLPSRRHRNETRATFVTRNYNAMHNCYFTNACARNFHRSLDVAEAGALCFWKNVVSATKPNFRHKKSKVCKEPEDFSKPKTSDSALLMCWLLLRLKLEKPYFGWSVEISSKSVRAFLFWATMCSHPWLPLCSVRVCPILCLRLWVAAMQRTQASATYLSSRHCLLFTFGQGHNSVILLRLPPFLLFEVFVP